MKYGSVCSGVEAASVAWEPLGWEPVFFSEIEAFPRAILKHRYPHVPCHGDFTTINRDSYAAIDVLVGGTPCQDFSLAGLRAGLDGGRGNLSLEFGRLLGRLRPTWFVWENVPGVLSSGDGKDFAGILGMFTGRRLEVPTNGWRNSGVIQGIDSAYSIAWRILDAQYFGVPQRRRRVFVVGCLGADWRRPLSVLLERQSLSGDSPPSREKREKSSGCPENSLGADSEVFSVSSFANYSSNHPPLPLTAGGDLGGGSEALVVETNAFRMEAFGQYEEDGTASTMKMRDYKDATDLVTHTPVAFTQNTRDEVRDLKDIAGCLGANEGMKQRTYLAYGIDEECNAREEQMGALLRGGEGGSRQSVVQVPIGIDGENTGYTLRANPSMSGDKGDGGMNTTVVAISSGIQIPENEIARTLTSRHDSSPDGDKGFNMVSVLPEDMPVTPINTQMALRGADTSNSNREGIGVGNPGDPSFTLGANHSHAVAYGSFVRRLTPTEAHRLQGFPDGWCQIPWRGKLPEDCPDGPQYKAMGNSMAVPVMNWIGKRIQMVHEFLMK